MEKYNLCSTHCCYRITINEKVSIAVTKEKLCEMIGYVPDKPFSKLTLQEVIESVNIPNLRVDRLNKPIP
jgi:hypothetical protein